MAMIHCHYNLKEITFFLNYKIAFAQINRASLFCFWDILAWWCPNFTILVTFPLNIGSIMNFEVSMPLRQDIAKTKFQKGRFLSATPFIDTYKECKVKKTRLLLQNYGFGRKRDKPVQQLKIK